MDDFTYSVTTVPATGNKLICSECGATVILPDSAWGAVCQCGAVWTIITVEDNDQLIKVGYRQDY